MDGYTDRKVRKILGREFWVPDLGVISVWWSVMSMKKITQDVHIRVRGVRTNFMIILIFKGQEMGRGAKRERSNRMW